MSQPTFWGSGAPATIRHADPTTDHPYQDCSASTVLGREQILCATSIHFIEHTMTAAKTALFLQLQLIMTALGMSTCTKFRPLWVSTKLRCSFQFQSGAPASASSGSRRWRSSAAYGRTTFRHIRGDVDSWRMTSSPDETSSSTPSSAVAAASIDLGPYRNTNNLDDQVFSAMSADGGLKVTVATIRNLLNEMMIQHSMNPVPGGEFAQRMIVISY